MRFAVTRWPFGRCTPSLGSRKNGSGSGSGSSSEEDTGCNPTSASKRVCTSSAMRSVRNAARVSARSTTTPAASGTETSAPLAPTSLATISTALDTAMIASLRNLQRIRRRRARTKCPRKMRWIITALFHSMRCVMTSPNERTGCRRLRDGTTTESDLVAGCDERSATSRAKKSSSRCTSSSDISSIDRRGLADAGLRVSGDNMPADPAAWTTGADQAPSGERPALLGLRVGVRAPHSPCLMRPSTVCTRRPRR